MLESFEIKNFRCFRDIKIEPFARVNLIMGSNNVGKTALLEAIYLHMAGNNLQIVANINGFRGIPLTFPTPSDDMVGNCRSLFHSDASNEPIQLIIQNDDKKRRSLEIYLTQQDMVMTTRQVSGIVRESIPTSENLSKPTTSLSTDKGLWEIKLVFKDFNNEAYESHIKITPTETATSQGKLPLMPLTRLMGASNRLTNEYVQIYSSLALVGRIDEVIEPLKILEKRLKQLSVLLMGQTPMLYGDIGLERLIPLPLMGQGMVRLTSIILAITQAEKGIVLIDEVENGLHHSTMKNVWKAINQAAKDHDLQIFATTHSWECICAAHEAFKEADPNDLRVIRLDNIKEDVDAIVYDQEMIETAISSNLEVR